MSNTSRAEYPRPDFQRSQWQNLNGVWNFAFDDEDRGKVERWYERPDFACRQIVVPFVYQCAASNIADLTYHPILWYSRLVAYEEDAENLRMHLCFAAVDHEAEVWVNGQFMGSHRGGYTPFSFDVTDALHPGSDNLVVVRCRTAMIAIRCGASSIGRQRMTGAGIHRAQVFGRLCGLRNDLWCISTPLSWKRY